MIWRRGCRFGVKYEVSSDATQEAVVTRHLGKRQLGKGAGVKDFGRLGRIGEDLPALPEVFDEVLRRVKEDVEGVRRVVEKDELYERNLEVGGDRVEQKAMGAWLRALVEEMGATWDEKVAGTPALVVFGNVGEHTDGSLCPYGDAAVEYWFVNVQIQGSGLLRLMGTGCDEGDAIWREYRVDEGEVYTFDQRMEHSWTQESNDTGLSMVVSFAMRAEQVKQALWW